MPHQKMFTVNMLSISTLATERQTQQHTHTQTDRQTDTHTHTGEGQPTHGKTFTTSHY